MNRLQILLQNKHTSSTAVLILVCFVGSVWFPDYADRFEKTSQLLFAYGLMMAGDAKAAEKESPSHRRTTPTSDQCEPPPPSFY